MVRRGGTTPYFHHTPTQQNWLVGYGAGAPAGPYSWPLVGILPRVLVNSDRILELNQEAHLQVRSPPTGSTHFFYVWQHHLDA